MRTLIIGLGNIGMGYDYELDNSYIQTHSRAAFLHQDFELVGGVDLSEHKREKFKNKYKSKSYKTIKDALENTQPDFIIISTPSSIHYETLETVFQYSSPEVILCEKPLDYDYESAKKILEICKQNSCKLFVNYFRRCDPSTETIKKLIATEALKTPFKGNVLYSKGLMNNASHLLDFFVNLLGPPNSFKVIKKGKSWDGIDINMDFIINFSLGEINFISKPDDSVSLLSMTMESKSGKLEYKKGGELITWNPVNDENINGSFTQRIELKNEFKIYQYNVLDNVSSYRKHSKSNLCTGEEALEYLGFINTMKEQNHEK